MLCAALLAGSSKDNFNKLFDEGYRVSSPACLLPAESHRCGLLVAVRCSIAAEDGSAPAAKAAEVGHSFKREKIYTLQTIAESSQLHKHQDAGI